MPHGFISRWSDQNLLGQAGLMAWNWTNALLWLLPLRGSVNWIHAIDAGLGAVFLSLWLRRRGLAWAAVALGSLTAFWLGTNFTLVYAGHNGKFGVLFLVVVTLWCLERYVEGRRWEWLALVGGALGVMVIEQQDVAFFFGLFLAPYVLLRCVQHDGWRWWRQVPRLATIGGIALLVGGGLSVRMYLLNMSGRSDGGAAEDERAKWEFCTQWSVPPDETIDLIAPGYTGWRSGDPEGPYWGRTGRSEGWEVTHQGFMNFRLESIYIGAIPVVLALFAVVAAFMSKGTGVGGPAAGGGINPTPTLSHTHTTTHFGTTYSDERVEILFWAACAVLALLLSYGKHFPLFVVLFKLPIVGNIRNPNKFLHVFQVALGILSAYGLDFALKSHLAGGEAGLVAARQAEPLKPNQPSSGRG